MLSGFQCLLLSCFSWTLLAEPLQDINDRTLQSDLGDPRLPSQPSSMSLVSNTTSSLVNASVPNDISVRCNGSEYGHKPDIDDCASILRRHIIGREQLKFGQRGSISAEKFVNLPYRLMGGT